MKPCPNCNSKSFALPMLIKAHLFGSRLHCETCNSNSKFGKANVFVREFLGAQVLLFPILMVVFYAVIKETLTPVLIMLAIIFVIYAIRLMLTPLVYVGLRSPDLRDELKKRGLPLEK